jgi:adenylate cyclase class IV
LPRQQEQKSKTGKNEGAHSRSHKEIEVKLRIADTAAFLRRLEQLGAKATGPRMHEMNTLFDSPDGRLASGGQMARVRVERPAPTKEAGSRGKSVGAKAKPGTGAVGALAQSGPVATLTYKGPATSREDGYKEREEHEVRIGNAGVLEGMCRLLGLRPWFRYEKYRTPYVLPSIKGV